MQSEMIRLAAMVPAAIVVMMLFVLVAAGSTIAFLVWRASRQ